MPIGTAKAGLLGRSQVAGGTQTFNASGTFTVPPGVSVVSVTGKGATGSAGNPGNAGNPGSTGNSGSAGTSGRGAGGGAGSLYFNACNRRQRVNTDYPGSSGQPNPFFNSGNPLSTQTQGCIFCPSAPANNNSLFSRYQNHDLQYVPTDPAHVYHNYRNDDGGAGGPGGQGHASGGGSPYNNTRFGGKHDVGAAQAFDIYGGPCTCVNNTFRQHYRGYVTPRSTHGGTSFAAMCSTTYDAVCSGMGARNRTAGGSGPSGSTGSSGNTGASGNPGSAGNAGATGAASTGLSRTFPGGAGGNGGAAGSGGSGGTGGAGGNAGSGGTGGKGGGFSAQSCNTGGPKFYRNSGQHLAWAKAGCGGNGGGQGACMFPEGQHSAEANPIPSRASSRVFGYGGGGAGECNPGSSSFFTRQPPGSGNSNTHGCGGNPGGGQGGGRCSIHSWPNNPPANANSPQYQGSAANAARAGGGGGGVGMFGGTGGGGGGRGNLGNPGSSGNPGSAGNPGGAGNPGAAANPTTFNCVPVSPGTSYPIVVGSPGGQVTISWNPQ